MPCPISRTRTFVFCYVRLEKAARLCVVYVRDLPPPLRPLLPDADKNCKHSIVAVEPAYPYYRDAPPPFFPAFTDEARTQRCLFLLLPTAARSYATRGTRWRKRRKKKARKYWRHTCPAIRAISSCRRADRSVAKVTLVLALAGVSPLSFAYLFADSLVDVPAGRGPLFVYLHLACIARQGGGGGARDDGSSARPSPRH